MQRGPFQKGNELLHEAFQFIEVWEERLETGHTGVPSYRSFFLDSKLSDF